MPSTLLPRIFARRTPLVTPLRRNVQTRTFSSSRMALYATKETMDKDSLKPVSTEYSQTGGDDAVAHESEAFDPSQTTPEGQQASGAADKKVCYVCVVLCLAWFVCTLRGLGEEVFRRGDLKCWH